LNEICAIRCSLRSDRRSSGRSLVGPVAPGG
jgi:hypothetical protein